MSERSIEIFIKPGCPWCVEAVRWLKSEGYEFIEHDVITENARFSEMIELTGQSKAPSLRVNGHGEDELVLADFGVDELEAFVEHHEIAPD